MCVRLFRGGSHTDPTPRGVVSRVFASAWLLSPPIPFPSFDILLLSLRARLPALLHVRLINRRPAVPARSPRAPLSASPPQPRVEPPHLQRTPSHDPDSPSAAPSPVTHRWLGLRLFPHRHPHLSRHHLRLHQRHAASHPLLLRHLTSLSRPALPPPLPTQQPPNWTEYSLRPEPLPSPPALIRHCLKNRPTVPQRRAPFGRLWVLRCAVACGPRRRWQAAAAMVAETAGGGGRVVTPWVEAKAPERAREQGLSWGRERRQKVRARRARRGGGGLCSDRG